MPAGVWSAIPEDWRDRITDGERIAAIAGRLFDRGAGVEPTHPWPHDDFVHGYWVEPGKILAGEYPGTPNSVERARSKVNLLVDHGIRTFVDLTRPEDGMTPYEPLVVDAAERRRLDLRRIHHPIPDMGTLAADDYDEIVTSIRTATERGGVYIHCWGGIGRTGTVVGCLFVDDGFECGRSVGSHRRAPFGHQEATHACAADPEQIDIIRQRGRTD